MSDRFISLLTSTEQQLLAAAQTTGQPIVLVTGVFDLLHEEHRKFLSAAAKLGRPFIVGIESDTRVRQMKGEGRPIQNQSQRQKQIQELGVADIVFILPDKFSTPQDHDQLIAELLPKYLAVSSHSPHLDKKQAILQKYGGQVKVVLDRNPAISTTQILAERSRDC